jgi:hypothetical protein
MHDPVDFYGHTKIRLKRWLLEYGPEWQESYIWYITNHRRVRSSLNAVKKSFYQILRIIKEGKDIRKNITQIGDDFYQKWHELEADIFRKRKAAGLKVSWYFHDLIHLYMRIVIAARWYEKYKMMPQYIDFTDTSKDPRIICMVCSMKRFKKTACIEYEYCDNPRLDTWCWREHNLIGEKAWRNIPEKGYIYNPKNEKPFSVDGEKIREINTLNKLRSKLENHDLKKTKLNLMRRLLKPIHKKVRKVKGFLAKKRFSLYTLIAYGFIILGFIIYTVISVNNFPKDRLEKDWVITSLEEFNKFNEINELEVNKNLNISYLYVNEIVDFTKIKKIGISEREQVIFDYLASKYTKKYGLPIHIPYLFALIESDFHTNAFNTSTSATGLFQITPICLQEFNNLTGLNYTMGDMYDIEKNFEVSMWYIHRLVTHFKVPLNNTYILYGAYNMGPGNFQAGTIIPDTIVNRYTAQVRKLELAYNE